MNNNEAQFTVDEKGDVSGREYAGVFKIKIRLSHNDRFRADAMRRALLGGLDPNQASNDMQALAQTMSQISIRVLDAPQWWKDSAGGTDISDFNIIQVIYRNCIDAENKAIEETQKKAEAAKVGLNQPIIKE